MAIKMTENEWKTEVKKGEFGAGLHALEFIPKGTKWWKFQQGINYITLTRQQYRFIYYSERKKCKLSEGIFQGISNYTLYMKKNDLLYLLLDNARFTNHSEDANSIFDSEEECSIALRDILPGEELTEDYSLYDEYCWEEEWCEFSEESGHISTKAREEYEKNNPIDEDYPKYPYKIFTPNSDRIRSDQISILETFVDHSSIGENLLGLFVDKKIEKGVQLQSQKKDDVILLITKQQWKTFINSEIQLSDCSSLFRDGILFYAKYNRNFDYLFIYLNNLRFIRQSLNSNLEIEEKGDQKEDRFQYDFVNISRDLKAGDELLFPISSIDQFFGFLFK